MTGTNTMTEDYWPPIRWDDDFLGATVMDTGDSDRTRLTVQSDYYQAGLVTENFPREVTDLTILSYSGPITDIPRWITKLELRQCSLTTLSSLDHLTQDWDQTDDQTLTDGRPPSGSRSLLPEGLKVLRICSSELVLIADLPEGLEEIYHTAPGWGIERMTTHHLPKNLHTAEINVWGYSGKAIKGFIPKSVRNLSLCRLLIGSRLDLSEHLSITDLTISYRFGMRKTSVSSQILLSESVRRLKISRFAHITVEIGRVPLLESLEVDESSVGVLTNGVEVRTIEEYARAWRTPKSARSAYVVPG